MALKVSKNISANFSLFSGGFIGGSVNTNPCSSGSFIYEYFYFIYKLHNLKNNLYSMTRLN